jgi:pyruvate dehydrogenase E2 component (dihydrolipoamide acetyltransferase)
MTTDFFIPKLEQTEEVTIVNWLVEDGAEINEGDEIVEIETDKAVVPVPANASGYLHIGAYKAGDIVSTLTVIATIGGQDEAFAPGSDGTGSQTVPAAEPVAATAAQLDPPSAAAEAESEAPATGSKPRATPVAQKMATDLGVDLQTVTGSGDHGKITKVDVRQAALPEKAPEPTPAPQPKAPSAVAIPDPSAPAEDVLERVPLKSYGRKRPYYSQGHLGHRGGCDGAGYPTRATQSQIYRALGLCPRL